MSRPITTVDKKRVLVKTSTVNSELAQKKLNPPKLSPKDNKEIVETPDGRRFRNGLELFRESESEEEITSRILPDQTRTRANGRKEEQRKKESALPHTNKANNKTAIETVQSGMSSAAISDDREDIAKVLSSTNASLDHQDSKGRSELMLAIDRGFTAEAEYFIRRGANIHLTDSEDATALMYAAKKGQIEIAEILIDHQADINFLSNKGYSALHMAVENKQIKMVELLIRKGADVHLSNKRVEPPLTSAVRTGNIDIICLLLEKNAKIDIRSYGNTALDIAVLYENLDVIKLLAEAGNHIDTKSDYYHSAYLKAIDRKHFEIAEFLGNHINPLYLDSACKNDFLKRLVNFGNLEGLRMILDKATTPESRYYSHKINLSFQEAFECASLKNLPEIANLLFDRALKLDILDFDRLAERACALIHTQITGKADDKTWEKFHEEIFSVFELGKDTADILMRSVRQYASAYTTSGQGLIELTDQQLKMIFFQSVASAQALHEKRNKDIALNDNQRALRNSTWVANLSIAKAQLGIEALQQPMKQFIKKLSPSTTTAQLRESARDAGWHPVVIKILTDIWTSLSRRRTKENFFAAIKVRLNTGEFVRKLLNLESDEARHMITLQLDTLARWINEPTGRNKKSGRKHLRKDL